MIASGELLSVLALLAALGLWRGWRLRPAAWPARLALALLPPLLGGLAWIYGETAALSTRWVWSACRLAPTVGLFHGYPLYSPADSGPINGWLYGPVAALAWAPAALANSPLPALAIAAVINLLGLLAPLLAAGSRAPLRPDVPGLLGFSFAAAAMLQVYPTWYMASALNADAIAVGLGAGSCLVLLHGNPAAGRTPWLAAVLAVLAAWTKQTEALLLVAQGGWLWFVHGRRTALRYTGIFAAVLAAATVLVGLCFRPADVLFNLWTVPSAHALPGGWRAAANEAVDFGRYTMLLWLPCLLILFVRRRSLASAAPTPAGPGPSVLLFIAVAVVALPLGILAAIKVGGDRNSLHSVYYLAVAAALTLGRLWPVAVARPTGLMAGALLFVVAGVTVLAGRQVAGYASLPELPKRCLSQEAWLYSRENPGKAYFPWDPLAGLMAEGRMYHFEYGVVDRVYAGLPPEPARMRRDLPARPEVVIYPRAGYARVMLRDYLPEFSFASATEDWLIHRVSRPSMPPATP